MSAEMAVRAAMIAALRADGALMALVNGVHDGEPARAAAPYGFAGECIGSDWGGKDLEGREIRLSVGLVAAADGAAALAAMIARVDPAMQGLVAADGWRVASARLVRSRIAREGPAPASGWRAVVDYRVRVVRDG
ncbi:DUF3168 domain-containing protein [Sphingobium amiense]|uniref:DUF3168 domain-containing protein n=1 Tax=Sphingobium amiense TaxID=135719 RepID=A0A494W9E3_9SPHN|nr:DUF3168 domain-containing protein [Sphingobium amiense]BBD96819.1 DUF3168 domain-containing protein [Sphingobium amiense]